jgi:hypothetical protein
LFILIHLESHAGLRSCFGMLGPKTTENKLDTNAFQSLEELTASAKKLVEETQNQCKRAGMGTLKFCAYSVSQMPRMVKNVWKFEATKEGFKTGISYPLADIITRIKDTQLSEQERQKSYFDFYLFIPEFLLKIQASLPSLGAGVAMDTATGLLAPNWNKNPGVAGDVAAGVRRIILVRILQNVRTNEQNADLNYFQRLKLALDKATEFDQPELVELANKIKIEMGFDRLQSALAN